MQCFTQPKLQPRLVLQMAFLTKACGHAIPISISFICVARTQCAFRLSRCAACMYRSHGQSCATLQAPSSPPIPATFACGNPLQLQKLGARPPLGTWKCAGVLVGLRLHMNMCRRAGRLENNAVQCLTSVLWRQLQPGVLERHLTTQAIQTAFCVLCFNGWVEPAS